MTNFTANKTALTASYAGAPSGAGSAGGFLLRPDVPMIKPVKLHANVGACLDIPTGSFVKGRHGESLLKGGVPAFFGIAGKANNFKSTILAWMLLTAIRRLTFHASSLSWYDTEVNVELYRLATLASYIEGYEEFTEENGTVFDRGVWVFTDKGNMSGNKWVAALQDFLQSKLKAARSVTRSSPFLDLDGKTLIEMLAPTASAVDTISEFESDDVMAMREKTEIGQKEGNTINMRQGLGKDRFIRETPGMCARGFHFMGMAAQWGEEKPDIGAGPMSGPKPKKMNTLRQGEKIRGVPDSFLYLPLHVWMVDGSSMLRDDDFYPLEPDDMSSESMDLWRCPMKMLRSKTGMSGFTVDVIVSQKRGVDPSMTEFYYISKTHKRYGIEGAGQYYTLDLLPDTEKLQRTTIRKALHANPALRRAVNLTSEICQIGEYYPGLKGRVPPLKDLRAKLIADGYDWNTLINTRGWWTLDNDHQGEHFLSSMDLIEMYHGDYVPFWLEADKKTVRKEFVRK